MHLFSASLIVLFDSFLFYCFLHFLVIHTGSSESKYLHSDWVASRKFPAPVPTFFRHIGLILQIDQDRILPRPLRSYATYLCHLTRCRPKPCIVTYTLRETGYSFEIFINIYQIIGCPIPKERNFNAYRHEKVKSVLTFQSITRMWWYRKPWKCHDVGYFMEIRNRHRRITTFKGCCLKLVLFMIFGWPCIIVSSSSSALQPWVGLGLRLRFRNNIFFTGWGC